MPTIPRKRHKPDRYQRAIPCESCGYPISQRHHLLPVARYGENNVTASLCANCHEGYHITEQGMLDFAAGRHDTHALYLMGAVREAWGGSDSPRIQYILGLLDRAHHIQRTHARMEDPPIDDAELIQRIRDQLDGNRSSGVRRGDMVRLTNGKIVQVAAVERFSIHTTDGIHSMLDIEKIARWD